MPDALSVSVVIPVRNAAEDLSSCLESLARSEVAPAEIIVVDDCSDTRATVAVAREAGATVIELRHRVGPGVARNTGVKEAAGDVVLFLDADVEVHPDTIGRLRQGLQDNPDWVASFGSYDRNPSGQNLFSQYRNLLHHYTHQNSDRHAFTFWSGCGAIRRTAFLENGGFAARFRHPSIEDIELGQRLTASGAEIQLRPGVLVRHRKVWRFLSMMRCDLLDRGIPWTRELLKLGRIPDDMNMRKSDRALVFTALLLTLMLIALILVAPLWSLSIPWVAGSLMVADRLSSAAGGRGLTRWWALRVVSVVESLGLLLLAWRAPESWSLIAIGLLLFGVFGVLRRQFYSILIRQRGIAFVFLSFQAHVLFYWVCGLAFGIGALMHVLRPLPEHTHGDRESLAVGDVVR